MVNKLGIFSFFSGAGFLDLGFETTGKYDVLLVNEFHAPFIEIYKTSRVNLNIKPPIYGYHNCDVAEFLSDEHLKLLKCHIKEAKSDYKLVGFIGGPPCPDFSIGGKNKGHEGDNGRLSGTYIDLICSVKPDFFLFENVRGLYRTKKHREFFDILKHRLEKSGYSLTEKLINAIEYGVPQDRERIILFGFRSELLKQVGLKTSDFNWSHGVRYKKEEIFQLNWPTQDRFEENSLTECISNIPIDLTVEYWFRKNDVEHHSNANKFFQPRAGLIKFKSIPEGDDLKKSYKRLHRWRYSPTAAYGNNEVHLHPYKARRISASEALAIQSLPKEFIIPNDVSLSNMFKTIGNGVPFLASRALAESLFIFLSPFVRTEDEYVEIDCK